MNSRIQLRLLIAIILFGWLAVAASAFIGYRDGERSVREDILERFAFEFRRDFKTLQLRRVLKQTGNEDLLSGIIDEAEICESLLYFVQTFEETRFSPQVDSKTAAWLELHYIEPARALLENSGGEDGDANQEAAPRK